ncbi:GSCOCG00007355001-RA-CDS [Cotesia congregata]|nr:GSCOCG00007355001-RA-CDS [Cotesia congregata]
MFKIILLGSLLACANAYYNHGAGFADNYYYGHYGPVPGAHPVAPVAPLYNDLTGVAPYVPKTVAQPIVDPLPTANRHRFHLNHLNLNHGYYHAGVHPPSPSPTPAPTPAYVPPPVVVPPSVTYNNNVVPPSVQNLNHAAPAPASALGPANYHHHALNYQHRPYAPIYTHGHMHNHVNYGW